MIEYGEHDLVRVDKHFAGRRRQIDRIEFCDDIIVTATDLLEASRRVKKLAARERARSTPHTDLPALNAWDLTNALVQWQVNSTAGMLGQDPLMMGRDNFNDTRYPSPLGITPVISAISPPKPAPLLI